jgi:serine/threonine protein kinase
VTDALIEKEFAGDRIESRVGRGGMGVVYRATELALDRSDAAGEYEGILYIAMRFVPGDDLRTVLREQGPIEPARAVRIIAQVASGVVWSYRSD